MTKNKEIKKCKQDCIENLNGYCRLKIKDDTPTDLAKIKEGKECSYYRKSKSLFED